jgi:streptomycin 6-kinase
MTRIPRALAAAAVASGDDGRARWLTRLPDVIDALAAEWSLEVAEPYEPGGTSAWIAPVYRSDGQKLVLKVGWRHMEAEEEADGLWFWNGDGAVRCVAAQKLEGTQALLLERCHPGIQLKDAVSELEQDVVIGRILRRLWEHEPPEGGPFRPLHELCDYWARELEAEMAVTGRGGELARVALGLLREPPAGSGRGVLLCTDLHAGNVLSAQREPWLAIDPKPFVGDPAFDPVQHMLNCVRLRADPVGLARRMATLLDLDAERVRLWLFARCAQEGLHDTVLQEVAERIAP